MYYFVCFVWFFFSCLFSLLILSKLSPPIDQICVVGTVPLPKPSPGFSRRPSKGILQIQPQKVPKRRIMQNKKHTKLQASSPNPCRAQRHLVSLYRRAKQCSRGRQKKDILLARRSFFFYLYLFARPSISAIIFWLRNTKSQDRCIASLAVGLHWPVLTRASVLVAAYADTPPDAELRFCDPFSPSNRS